MIYTAEKAVKDNGAKITPEIVKGVEDKIADLKKAKEGSDLTAIKTATEALSAEMQKIGEAMAKAQQANPGQTAPGADAEKKDENIKDAEFKEKGEETKQIKRVEVEP